MGRPPLPEGTARTESVSVKWTKHEKACLSYGAEVYGVDLPEVIRQCCASAILAWSKAIEIDGVLKRLEARKEKRRAELDARRKAKGK